MTTRDATTKSHDHNPTGARTNLEANKTTVKWCNWCQKRLGMDYKLATCPAYIEQLTEMLRC